MKTSKLFAMLFGTVLVAAHAAPGDLDAAFGTGGSVISAISTSGDDSATTVAIQPDGKIVAAGECQLDFCVARYNANGTLDTTFNTTGKVITPVGMAADHARAIALQSDGKIVVAGSCDYEILASPQVFAAKFCVVRYTTTGALDTSFNGTGKLLIAIGAGAPNTTYDEGISLAVQTDGKIVVAGICGAVAFPAPNAFDFCVARLTSTGAFDTTFNGTGKVVTAVSGSNNVARSVIVQADGKIVVAGGCLNGATTDFCIVRYGTSGILDNTFNASGTPGKFTFPVGTDGDFANSVTIQSDGKYILAGTCSAGGNADFCVARVTTAGALDTTFNGTGKVITAIGDATDILYGVAIQLDGTIVVAGDCFVSGNHRRCLARYTAAGALDATFSGDGLVIDSTRTASNFQKGMALQVDGKIVIVAGCSNGANGDDFCVQRYDGYPTPPCRLDIDGDGLVLATTDSLVHARIAIGLSGNAVTNGIGFPVAATRKTWTDIRAYLVASCAMILPP